MSTTTTTTSAAATPVAGRPPLRHRLPIASLTVWVLATLWIVWFHWISTHTNWFPATFGWRLLVWAILIGLSMSLLFAGRKFASAAVAVLAFVLAFAGGWLIDLIGGIQFGGIISVAFALLIILLGIAAVIWAIGDAKNKSKTTA